jgi:hypothetical protein
VVVTVRRMLPAPLIVDGLKLQVLSAGNPEQVKFTVPVKPSNAPTEKLRVPAPPGDGIVILDELRGLMVKSGWRLKVSGALEDDA